MAELTATQIKELNGMCVAAGKGAIGTKIAELEGRIEEGEGAIGDIETTAIFGVTIEHVVTAAEGIATEVEIDTGLEAIVGFIYQVKDSTGDAKPMFNATVADGVITIANVVASGMVLAEDDIITGIAW